MRLNQDALDMIKTARDFAGVDLTDGVDVGELEEYTGPVDDDLAQAMVVAAVIGASQVLIGALLDIIDSDDEAQLAMMKNDTPRVDGKTADIDPDLFAAWADAKEMLRYWEGAARAREFEVRAVMRDAQAGLVGGQPAVTRIMRTDQVRAHTRRVDYLKLTRWDGGTL